MRQHSLLRCQMSMRCAETVFQISPTDGLPRSVLDADMSTADSIAHVVSALVMCSMLSASRPGKMCREACTTLRLTLIPAA